MYVGEIISLFVAISWTVTALCAEIGSKRIGPLQMNVIRMVLSLAMLGLTLWIVTGSPLPQFADGRAWLWLSLSGAVGYVFGDYCLFNSYIVIGSRFGQLFMTLAPPAAALSGWLILGEKLSLQAWLGMMVTLFGIGISVMSKGGGSHKFSFKLPVKGILLGIGAGVGQGVGLVLSKVGMNYYEMGIPESASEVTMMLPFTATMMRAVTGLFGFVLIMALRKELATLAVAVRDVKGMRAAMIATITGPFIGVSLSLMAVRYTEAGIASTLMALTPIFILWPSHVLFGAKVSLKEVLGAVISVAGVSLFFI